MPKRRPDHVPTRTCAVCRLARPKRDMTRIVRTPEGTIQRDETGRLPGRGTYICHDQTCSDVDRRVDAVKRALGGEPAPGTLDFEGVIHATT
jgi:predicted RNA-binding protein YlxR (DUF448 family)